MTTTTTPRKTTDDVITGMVDKLVDTLTKGEAGSWTKPWTQVLGAQGMPTNVQTTKAYQGLNVMVLWAEALIKDYTFPVWGTYRQWQGKKAQVRKGEHGTILVKWGITHYCDGAHAKPYKSSKGPCTIQGHRNDRRKAIWASPFVVFNVDQVDGYELPEVTKPETTATRLAKAEALVTALGADIREKLSDRAYYTPNEDYIVVPDFAQFASAEGYYGTLFHELTHWTGHETRLKRDNKNFFGDEKYAQEELIAELGSTFMAAHLGIELEPHINHAAYLKSWLGALKAEPMVLYRSARDASAAAQYLLGQAVATQEGSES